MVDVERWLSYKDTCHVILLAKLHDMYLYKTTQGGCLIEVHVMQNYMTCTFIRQHKVVVL